MHWIEKMPLYIVGTPLGNLNDFSKRGVDVLQECSFIAAEDTRVTKKLLMRFDISTPLIPYHQHNRAEKESVILGRLLAGESGALVSDAGMPVISDPGAELVAACHEQGIDVFVVPGPCALSSAVALSGFETGRFSFEGFLSTAQKSRKEHLAALTKEERVMVFYEAPHKLLRTLKDMWDVLGDRDISISREMTKIHEETLRGRLSEMLAHFEKTPPKGEFVLVVKGAAPPSKMAPEEVFSLAKNYMDEGLSLRDAARKASLETGHPKRDIYEALLAEDL